NATGINSFSQETLGKRLRLLHDLMPKAIRIALLLNPDNVSSTEATLREVGKAADQISLKIQVLNAKTSREIDSAFDLLAKDRPDALFAAPDAFFNSRGAQFATLTARERIASTFSDRAMVAAGGLMSYGADLGDMARLGRWECTRALFSKAQNPLTYQTFKRPNCSLPLIFTQHTCLASMCPQGCSRLPTR